MTTKTFDVYQLVTDRIIEMLEQGVAPWRSPILGQAKAGWPKNLESGKDYRGVNVFLLAFTAWAKGYESSCWLTFNQARNRGGMVRKGEKASVVVFWKSHETKDKDTGEAITVPVLRYYHVFNAEQCENIAPPDAAVPEGRQPEPFSPIESAEAIANGYRDGPRIEHAGGQAFYRPGADTVRLPEPPRFISREAYYATLFHELAHSTGHSDRLDRGLDVNPAPFGSADYGREELIAEMTAAFLCGHAGIVPATIDNAAAYLGAWIKTLKGDKRLAVAAAGAGQRAADWIRDIRPQGQADTGTA